MPPLRSTPDIPLTQELDRLVAKHLASGRYRSAGEVLHAALRRLDDAPPDATAARLGPTAAERDAVLGQLTEGVIVTDPAGRITFVNEAAARLHGVAQLDVPPSAYSATYHLFTEDGEPYPPEELPLARAVLRGDTVVDARWRIRRPDGTEVLAIGSAKPLRAPNRTAVGAVLTLRDDTAREAAERALRESEARFRTMADSAPALIWMTDAEANVIFANHWYQEVFARPPGEILGDGWRQIVHADDVDAFFAKFFEAFGGRRRFEAEVRVWDKDGRPCNYPHL